MSYTLFQFAVLHKFGSSSGLRIPAIYYLNQSFNLQVGRLPNPPPAPLGRGNHSTAAVITSPFSNSSIPKQKEVPAFAGTSSISQLKINRNACPTLWR
jgi:hypothetical protein